MLNACRKYQMQYKPKTVPNSHIAIPKPVRIRNWETSTQSGRNAEANRMKANTRNVPLYAATLGRQPLDCRDSGRRTRKLKATINS
jgi:hypothetical protein